MTQIQPSLAIGDLVRLKSSAKTGSGDGTNGPVMTITNIFAPSGSCLYHTFVCTWWHPHDITQSSWVGQGEFRDYMLPAEALVKVS